MLNALAAPCLSRFDRRMRTCTILFVLAMCVSVRADIPKYEPMRDWVEQHSATNAVRKEARIFIGSDLLNRVAPNYAAIVSYREGMRLEEVVEGTPYEDTDVTVLVMRAGGRARFIRMKPSDKLDFELKPGDLIWIYDHPPIF